MHEWGEKVFIYTFHQQYWVTHSWRCWWNKTTLTRFRESGDSIVYLVHKGSNGHVGTQILTYLHSDRIEHFIVWSDYDTHEPLLQHGVLWRPTTLIYCMNSKLEYFPNLSFLSYPLTKNNAIICLYIQMPLFPFFCWQSKYKLCHLI